MLAYIASYSPKHLLREITERCESLEDVWKLLRKWAGIQESGLKVLEYSRMQITWDPSGDISPSEFYYALLDTMQDVLLIKDGSVRYNQKPNTENEDMTPTLKSMVVKDWLVSMGGQQLFEHVCRVYAKDLEVSTLADIQHRIAQNLDSLTNDIESMSGTVKALRIFRSNQSSSLKVKSQNSCNIRNIPQQQTKSSKFRGNQTKKKICIL